MLWGKERQFQSQLNWNEISGLWALKSKMNKCDKTNRNFYCSQLVLTLDQEKSSFKSWYAVREATKKKKKKKKLMTCVMLSCAQDVNFKWSHNDTVHIVYFSRSCSVIVIIPPFRLTEVKKKSWPILKTYHALRWPVVFPLGVWIYTPIILALHTACKPTINTEQASWIS